MIHGIGIFRRHFADHFNKYVLIGGAASHLLMEERGFDPRATKDLDIVLTLETMDTSFLKDFWRFIAEGGYKLQERSTGEKRFYQFQNPENKDFPLMIELFSRGPDQIELAEGATLTPIPADEEVSSLSAILLNDDYYNLIQQSRYEIDGVAIVDKGCLIPLKAYAWCDLRERRAKGEEIDSKKIRKHETDILKLSEMILEGDHFDVPELAQKHIREFLANVADRKPSDLAAISVNVTMEEAKENVARAFL